MNTPDNHTQSGMTRYLVVYVCILAIAGLQFAVAYHSASRNEMFTRMLLLALLEAALGILFFMHLWSERRSLIIFVLSFMIGVLITLQYSWPDSLRILVGAPFSSYH
jgi:heme/copper-type cytochrome/quinol oxidase subunit 4